MEPNPLEKILEAERQEKHAPPRWLGLVFLLPVIALIGWLVSCQSIVTADAYASQKLMGQLYPPAHLAEPLFEYELIEASMLEIFRFCGMPAAECVRVVDGQVVAYVPHNPPEWIIRHAEGHVTQAQMGARFSHKGWLNHLR